MMPLWQDIDQQYESTDIHEKEQGHADNKARLSDLVSENEHSEDSAD